MTLADISVRRASMEDIDQLSLLFIELDEHHIKLRPDLFKQLHGPARDRDALVSLITNAESQAVFVAELPSYGLIGLVHVLERRSPETVVAPATVSAEVDSVAINHAYRRLGVAKALIRQAEQWAKERRIGKLVLSVRAFNDDALQAYMAMGFEPVVHRMERAIVS